MHPLLKDILDNKDRWIGGVLVSYGKINETFPPAVTRINLIQLEDDRYFAVIGDDFGCNGDIAILGPAMPARFPASAPGEVALMGAHGHEWHLIPKPGGEPDVTK